MDIDFYIQRRISVGAYPIIHLFFKDEYQRAELSYETKTLISIMFKYASNWIVCIRIQTF